VELVGADVAVSGSALGRVDRLDILSVGAFVELSGLLVGLSVNAILKLFGFAVGLDEGDTFGGPRVGTINGLELGELVAGSKVGPTVGLAIGPMVAGPVVAVVSASVELIGADGTVGGIGVGSLVGLSVDSMVEMVGPLVGPVVGVGVSRYVGGLLGPTLETGGVSSSEVPTYEIHISRSSIAETS